MGLVKEFKEFALKGNVVDLAVGVIIGAAFSAVIKSLVDDVITPLLLNPIMEKANLTDISQLSWNGVKYGSFISAGISFLLVALVLFSLIKVLNNLNKNKSDDEVIQPPSSQETLLIEIRDILVRK